MSGEVFLGYVLETLSARSVFSDRLMNRLLSVLQVRVDQNHLLPAISTGFTKGITLSAEVFELIRVHR